MWTKTREGGRKDQVEIICWTVELIHCRVGTRVINLDSGDPIVERCQTMDDGTYGWHDSRFHPIRYGLSATFLTVHPTRPTVKEPDQEARNGGGGVGVDWNPIVCETIVGVSNFGSGVGEGGEVVALVG